MVSDLSAFFSPRSIAVIGASDEEGTVGWRLMKNLMEYKGNVYPVNIRKDEVLGVKAYRSVEDIPESVDLAVIATPAPTVPGIVEQCGRAGVKNLIIISAGFREVGEEGRALEAKIIEARDRYALNIIGPNCLGIIRPSSNLNATFLSRTPKPGNVAFISQSGALGSAIVDWAVNENIGFSAFISVGSMLDVDFGDLIEYLGKDPETKSILLYIEGISDAKRFMSAARHFSRTKPIIVVKAGKFAESARAVQSHTGSLAGEDVVYDAAFKRAGVIRVDEISELFNCAEALAKQPLPNGPRLAIITNAGGPAIMATDALIASGGRLAELDPNTIEELNRVLPKHWSKGNPIDLIGDADASRYRRALELCLKDSNVDGILVVYTPTMIDSVEIARTVVDVCKDSTNSSSNSNSSSDNSRYGSSSKPVLTSFMFQHEANRILNENGIPTYDTPEQAVKTFIHMYQYKHRLEMLYQTPEALIDFMPPKRPLLTMINNAIAEKRRILDEVESKEFISYYNIPVVRTLIARSEDEAVALASSIGYPVVLKIYSKDITHKSDVGGVMLNLNDEHEVREAYNRMMQNVRAKMPDARIDGVTVQPMVKMKGVEVILGARYDPIFGPVILFGMGGVGVELFKDFAVGLPPLNQVLARMLMEETRVHRLLKGYRDIPAADMRALEQLLVSFSQMLIDFPEIEEVDINPLLVHGKNIIALDARIVVDEARASARAKAKAGKDHDPYRHLIISPYPKRYERLWTLKDGRIVLLRPIKPEDEPLWLDMFRHLSQESVYQRFFTVIKDTPHEQIVRYCNIDYAREMSIVAELSEGSMRRIIGVASLVIDGRRSRDGYREGEIAVIVADPWQGLGLGTKLVDYILEIAEDMNVKVVNAVMLANNARIIDLMKRMGFRLEALDEDTLVGRLELG
ncbi:MULTISPECIES: bifunctional acetate--CoA ligase family protein/GNAT family N-acetyltransferase [Candidatus Nitrosocaldus]|jgi:acetyltransferase|uniref:Acetyl CoA synthetase subunit alpha n=1 Tax=Candidatus Nitrosocaldus cavascurensis TaxID=2058097 RepID=A0A2K5AQ19_9ARCH|nr:MULTISPECIES: bifunctional acetate--CoA ligase family protein/GNAT family N-acetyltransferase [Candidatus Nitrosocaldus]SPC33707.1 Acetyl CoA synthetase subunit alpha [Candidatus Nitrosocaldus cavascurensis]